MSLICSWRVTELFCVWMARQLSDFTRRSIYERSVSVRSLVKLLLRTKPKGWTPNASNT